MKKNIVIIGLGRFGLKLIESFKNLNVDILAIDSDVQAVTKASELTPNVIVCDSTNENSLIEAGLHNVDHAIVAFGQDIPNNLSKTIITTINLASMNIKHITVRIDEDRYQSVLKKIGATDFISPLQFASDSLALKVSASNFIDYFKISEEYSVVEIKIKSDFKKINLAELNTPKKFGTNIILIKRETSLFMPKANDNIEPNDVIFTFGKMNDISRLDNYLNKHNK